ncbi:hypothetical protein K435DRAFT_867745 [Dendrothele bispora CBS 962.96]|uniref:Uncharacterized protein n=1 Tax=Dendrothele bispora (strain CBS 962.96) TaxID=1314807 RepID=A0A4S8LER7_DENBC|nr:hypothetical protein K435DRAFT_867745 [Dendrothele bispora CBS 962.96]
MTVSGTKSSYEGAVGTMAKMDNVSGGYREKGEEVEGEGDEDEDEDDKLEEGVLEERSVQHDEPMFDSHHNTHYYLDADDDD